MKPFLVHLHIYYTDMWEELSEKLNSISSYDYDFYVTLVQKNDELKKKILEFNPNAHIEVVENRGFDVGPFVHTLNKINLDNYSYVIKVHSKRSINQIGMHVNNFDMTGTKWRDYLLEFLESKETFNKCLNCLENCEQLGMITNHRLIVSSKLASKKTRQIMNSFCKEYQLQNKDFYFVAGTMFIARANLFKKLQELNIHLTDFEPASTDFRHRQLAHQVERIIGLIVYLQGYSIKDPFTPRYRQIILRILSKLKSFFYQTRITSSGRYIVKVCKIPVYWKKTT